MSAHNSLEARVRARLASLESQGLLRSLQPPTGIDLCSNDYLNLSSDPRVTAGLIEGAAREGCGSTGSRLLRGERDAFEAIERRFARFKEAERALYFSTGYMANVAVLATLAEEGDLILSDERNHASLIDGMRLSRARTEIFPHNDLSAVRRLLRDSADGLAVGARGHRQRFIVVESLFSMDGDVAPLGEYVSMARDAGAVLVVDEAHAVGIYGARGSGLLEGLLDAVVISINTAGKALGVSGAFVAGPSWAIEYLVQRARPFVFSTAPPPALASALDASLTIIEEEPERRARLLERSSCLRARLQPLASSFQLLASSSQIIPILIGDNQRAMNVAKVLQAEGFDVRAIRPPSVPAGTARLRISVNAGLSHEVLDRFVDVLAASLREIGLCAASS